MTNISTGGCLCGAVSFQIMGEFESFFLCHCSRCRKDSGSAHSANLFSSQAEVKWLSGQERVKTFTLAGSEHSKSFCAECGSALPIFQEKSNLLVVPAGSLESQVKIRPNAHICFSSRADWDNQLADLVKLDGVPS